MRPCENVIVTLRLGREELDMELPTFLPIYELKGKIQETICVIYPDIWRAETTIELIHNDRMLVGEDTLASCGIWDGSILECVLKRG